jgi:hypothetical protein
MRSENRARRVLVPPPAVPGAGPLKTVFLVLTTALTSLSAGCSNSQDQLALQEAQNRQLYLQLQRERELNAQRERELSAQRDRELNAQRERDLAVQREREAVQQQQDQPPLQDQRHTKGAPSMAPDADKSLPKDNVTNVAIDDGFKQWSSTWMFDRYIPGSARATDRGLKDDTYVIRGLFDFLRGGSKLTIPFAAAFTRPDGGYKLSNLCYNDSSSGMTDCIDPSSGMQRAAAQSRQFLGSIVLLGLAAAITAPDDGEICEKRYSFFGDPYLYCY